MHPEQYRNYKSGQQKSGRAGRLRVLSSMFEEDEMPVKHLFRKIEEMPMLEQKALQLTKPIMQSHEQCPVVWNMSS